MNIHRIYYLVVIFFYESGKFSDENFNGIAADYIIRRRVELSVV